MIQCPEAGTMPCVTLSSAARITVAIVAPNDFSPPIASTGIFSRSCARNARLSIAS